MISFSVFRHRFTPLLAAALFLMPAIPAAAHDQGSVSISGRGEVSAPPDLVTITMGVVSQAETAAEALSQNNAQLSGVFAVLDAEEIDELDRQTNGLSVQPNWIYPRDNSDKTPPYIASYTVSNTLRVRIRDLDRLGEILDALVRDGANQFQGLSFGVTDPAPLLEQARKAAAADALAKAQLYADALGIALGDVKSLSENGQVAPPPTMMRAEAMILAEVAPSVPVATGQVSFTSTVHITWAIDQ